MTLKSDRNGEVPNLIFDEIDGVDEGGERGRYRDVEGRDKYLDLCSIKGERESCLFETRSDEPSLLLSRPDRNATTERTRPCLCSLSFQGSTLTTLRSPSLGPGTKPTKIVQGRLRAPEMTVPLVIPQKSKYDQRRQ